MRVLYLGKDSRAINRFKELKQDGIALLWNDWDDYGNRTTFPTWCFIGGREVELGAVKIMFDGVNRSHPYLVDLMEAGWDGVFPIKNANYVSVPASTVFYEQIIGALDIDAAVEVATTLRDASHLVRNGSDDAATALIADSAFDSSLLRERGAQRAFEETWRILNGNVAALSDIDFRYCDVDGALRYISLPFSTDVLLPRDINVVIGPNGVGKSRLLRQMADAWLNDTDGDTESPGFDSPPRASQLVVVSYSPFELFPVDTLDADRGKLQDADVYRYFGLRGRGEGGKKDPKSSINLSRSIPKVDAAKSLIDALSHDLRFGRIKEWSAKIATMEAVLGTAIEFDYAALALKPNVDDPSLAQSPGAARRAIVEYEDSDGDVHRYLRISADRVDTLVPHTIRKSVNLADGVSFFKDGKPVGLSSGQRLFSYIVINILGAIRQNSLILVDEPELFLHPTLEIRFVAMLKDILAAYSSKAILATHSVVTVREVPADCVHVFSRNKEGIQISHPPFETFGGDVQRITSYVFEDKNVAKPHEAWLRLELRELGSAEALINALGDDINEELIVQISAMEAGKW